MTCPLNRCECLMCVLGKAYLSASIDLPLDTVRAGDHCDLRMSRHMLPLLLMLGWYILVVKATCWEKSASSDIWQDHPYQHKSQNLTKTMNHELTPPPPPFCFFSMVFGGPTHLWWFKGIVCGEVNCKEEHSALVRTVTLTGNKREREREK